MLASIVITILSAWVFTEFVGYWLHMLLHSERIEFLSRNHMIHHLVIYAPNKPMRLSTEYIGSTDNRTNSAGFGTMHDGMHLKGFWMEANSWLSRWFLSARKLHDIHQMKLEDTGRQTKNFGICFFFFDRLFGTLSSEHQPFNHKGLEAAMRRYAYIFIGPAAETHTAGASS